MTTISPLATLPVRSLCVICKRLINDVPVDGEFLECHHNRYIAAKIKSTTLQQKSKLLYFFKRRGLSRQIEYYENLLIEVIRSNKCYDCGLKNANAKDLIPTIITFSAIGLTAIVAKIILISIGGGRHYNFSIIITSIASLPTLSFAIGNIASIVIKNKTSRAKLHFVYSHLFTILLIAAIIFDISSIIYAL